MDVIYWIILFLIIYFSIIGLLAMILSVHFLIQFDTIKTVVKLIKGFFKDPLNKMESYSIQTLTKFKWYPLFVFSLFTLIILVPYLLIVLIKYLRSVG